MYRKISKMSIFLITLILIFVCIAAPYQKVKRIALVEKGHPVYGVEEKKIGHKDDSTCGIRIPSSRFATEIIKYKNLFQNEVIEEKEFFQEELVRVVIEPKFRPQEARSNLNDENTNKCLLFKANNGKIKKGDFVVFL